MPKTAKAKAKSPARGAAGPATKRAPPAMEDTASPRSHALEDAVEDLGDIFDESLRHLIATDRDGNLSAGPVVQVSSRECVPGTLGWTVGLSGGDALSGGGEELGTLYLFVLPKPPRGSSATPDGPPLRERRWDEFTSIDLWAGPPRILLLAKAAEPNREARLRLATHALFQHLQDELA